MTEDILCEKIGKDEDGPAFQTFYILDVPRFTRCSVNCPYGLNDFKNRYQIEGEPPFESYCPINGVLVDLPAFLESKVAGSHHSERVAI